MAWQNSRNAARLKTDVLEWRPGTVVYTVGDYEHSTGTSDHNPDDPDTTPAGGHPGQTDSDSTSEVRAVDVMIGPRFSAADAAALVQTIITDPANRARTFYAIHAGYIYRRATGFKKERYTGSDQHHDHVHVSTLASQDNNATPWVLPGDQQEAEDFMTPEEKKIFLAMAARIEMIASNKEKIGATWSAHWDPNKPADDPSQPYDTNRLRLAIEADSTITLDAVGVSALADAIVARLPESTVTPASVRAALADVLLNGAAA